MSSCLEKGQVSCHLQAYDPVEVSYWGLARHERRGSIWAVSGRSHPPLDIALLIRCGTRIAGALAGSGWFVRRENQRMVGREEGR